MNPEDWLKELENEQYVKSRVKNIAQKFNLNKSELEKFYHLTFLSEIAKFIDLPHLTEINLNTIEQKIPDSEKPKFNFIKNSLKKLIEKCLYIAMKNGFSVNLNKLDEGIMTANAGDSAEFIFVARAILAGFNCSIVDVRSSRYDAIIDYDNKLLRVQVKGISTGNTISFKDRDRGGQGIDHTHERNLGKRITSQDCDLYVAVDKQVGMCYMIPMTWADTLSLEEAKTVKLSDIEYYKENWNIIKQTVESLYQNI